MDAASPSPAASPPLLQIRNLSKSFGDLLVLDDISLDVPRSSVTTLIGASGSGKSTLLRCINRMEIPSSGEVLLDGDEVGTMQGRREGRVPASAAALSAQRAEMGMVFQHFNLWPHMTALGNVMVALRRVRRMSRATARETAEHFLDRVGMLEHARRFPARLSGGQQQRVAIARALAMRPRLMLFDEATSSLDPELTHEVLLTMQALADEGMTMMIVTHEMAFARAVSDRIVFLHKGRLEVDGPPETVFGGAGNANLERFLRTVQFGGAA
ncbi:amino acid ABC transporter ATP-binding protein [Acuticoccus kandeliae]|uniref:amino acid ABC transporter ATP-binding protein n=1 Tax=Acuticoccus kandeliae TaxID=2073160 RepID=UPI00196A4F60|nr:amino acid ABC transporter ATP-binding protein [Acuticoccus kandeliae]